MLPNLLVQRLKVVAPKLVWGAVLTEGVVLEAYGFTPQAKLHSQQMPSEDGASELTQAASNTCLKVKR